VRDGPGKHKEGVYHQTHSMERGKHRSGGNGKGAVFLERDETRLGVREGLIPGGRLWGKKTRGGI